MQIDKLLILLLISGFVTGRGYSQNRTIKGKVVDNHAFQSLGYVSIVINDTVEVGRTDLGGFFQIEIPVSLKKISFRSVGMESADIELADECDEVEIVMMMRANYDFITLKKVDRLRKKEFKKLPELHKIAFEKGLFKTDKACYSQEFIPHYTKNRNN